MSLFDPEDDEAVVKGTEGWDVLCANTLRTAVVESTHRVCGWSRSSWASDFRKLRESIPEQAEIRIVNVLWWYKQNIGKPMVPEVFCANSFRRKFDRIEAAMRRDQRDNPTVHVTDTAKGIAERLLMKGWPKGSDQDVPVVVQISIDNVLKFAEVLIRYLDNSKRHDLLHQFASRVMTELGSPRSFAESWMNWVHGRIKDWDDWNGPLARWAFSTDHAQFHRLGAGWAARYGDVRLWARLMEAMNAGQRT